jgi:riboflavin synthase
MFTGIIKETGVVRNFRPAGDVSKLDIESVGLHKDIGIGDSVAANGVCLTLTGKDRRLLLFDVTGETLKKSTLAGLKTGDRVNLEPAVSSDGAFGGHFVTGHVDCVGTIRDAGKTNEYVISVGFPENFSHLVVEKGSVAVDGVSLTAGEVTPDSFRVYIIPHTLKTTTLGAKKRGDPLNIEFDIIGKYCARFLAAGRPVFRITDAFLRDKGF